MLIMQRFLVTTLLEMTPRNTFWSGLIVDFYCPKANIIIELDGGQHYMNKGKKKDKKRDNYLRAPGLKVLRFSDKDFLKNQREVLEKIWENL